MGGEEGQDRDAESLVDVEVNNGSTDNEEEALRQEQEKEEEAKREEQGRQMRGEEVVAVEGNGVHSQAIPEPVRENLVSTAVHFLQNPRVEQSALSQKRAFLLRKGLHSHEIDLAIERALSGTQFQGQVHRQAQGQALYQPQYHPNNTLIVPPPPPPHPHPLQSNPSFWLMTRSVAPSVALMAGLLYGAYMFYKQYLEHRLFGYERKTHPLLVIQENVQKLTESMINLKESLHTIESNLKSQIEKELASYSKPNPAEVAAINDIKSEICSLKALLLNRRQFPASPLPKPTIPSWQLTDKTEDSVDGNGVNQTDRSDQSESPAEFNSPLEVLSPASSISGDSLSEKEEDMVGKKVAPINHSNGIGFSEGIAIAASNGH